MTPMIGAADLIVSWLILGLILALSIRAVVRWIRRGRVESYSQADLMPKWLRGWLLGESESGDSAARRSPTGPITIWGWMLLACIVVWLLIRST